MASRWRSHILSGARLTGLEDPLRRAQRSVQSREAKRDRRDLAHLDLLLALGLPSQANCVDVGANVGEVLGRIVARHPGGEHVAFEPLPELAERLGSRFGQVDVRQAAVGDTSGTATFHRNLRALSRSAIDAVEARARPEDILEPLSVEVQVLDESLAASYVPHLLKVDVEGNELAVIRGARGLLKRHRPVLVIEHGASCEDRSSSLHAELRGSGYVIYDIDGGGPYEEGDFLATVSEGRLWTWVAHR